ncbi:MAG: hypothetical protein R3E92_17115 [Burkholderiaceae bacterium]|nr:hypothetical protein [Rhodoferax sp.]MCB2007063.1 hypothetical protein [Rhodoferax sp.]MCB2031739.1 hypothetical protein [Rhodoferax sp.]MCP5262333.1 hypothetical protein [Rhodoferax sp.]MCW5643885.1 hypothetical protein [Rhodoferax sp.]
MNTTTRIAPIHSAVTPDAVSPLIAHLRAWGTRLGTIAWLELQAFGARRALREMRMMGLGTGIEPATPVDPVQGPGQRTGKIRADAAAVDAARQAACVRAMARQYHLTEPGFAADLCAAADRHEATATLPAR